MAIAGNLQEMSLPTLVQLVRQEHEQARIELHDQTQTGRLYLADDQLIHAELFETGREDGEIQTGEEVVYELLSWRAGEFIIEKGISASEKSIEKSWDFLLMEGLRRLDESQAAVETPDEEASLSEMLLELSESDAAAIRELVAQQEEDIMATKSEQLQAILDEAVQGSSDLTGAAIVSRDGLLMASVFSGAVDGNRVAAVSAGLVSLAGRSASQLQQGNVRQTLIQAENGNVVAIRAGDKASLVALTGPDANLGMVFLECGDMSQAIAAVL